MKALRKLASGAGHLELVDVPDPRAVPGHVVLAVKAAGVCGTDIHILHDEFPTIPPVTLGHEVAGEVVEVGSGISDWSVGDRVVTETYYGVCLQCEYCRAGYSNLCAQRRSIGSKVDGGFAEYLEVPGRLLHRIPDSLSWETAALTEPLACTVHALNQVRIHPGDWVVVSGPGPMGLLALQVARAAGGRVIALGLTQDTKRLEVATQLGAHKTFNVEVLGSQQAIAEVTALTNGGAHVVLECAGAGPSADLLLQVVRKRGAYGQIGLYGKPVPIDVDTICYKELSVSGTNASIPEAWPRALELLQLGLVKSEAIISGTWSLQQWQDAFAKVQEKGALKVLMAP
ncbi:alcohol dehydrogenase catalytic domain-containing protein [Dictyobacter sp. S3.2.2.5]|uniref:Alcohol dehydrogenase catalytic domain-containing protein n=1 Tax=Dictyobacter halimunensis TaxID=3026934 RepID=A0ABQ6FQ66_9CHLR|nr:alcohol dehydrogenase catalytic domain-containing protein [Dictyobacter sp. S3.2.2.5]